MKAGLILACAAYTLARAISISPDDDVEETTTLLDALKLADSEKNWSGTFLPHSGPCEANLTALPHVNETAEKQPGSASYTNILSSRLTTWITPECRWDMIFAASLRNLSQALCQAIALAATDVSLLGKLVSHHSAVSVLATLAWLNVDMRTNFATLCPDKALAAGARLLSVTDFGRAIIVLGNGKLGINNRVKVFAGLSLAEGIAQPLVHRIAISHPVIFYLLASAIRANEYLPVRVWADLASPQALPVLLKLLEGVQTDALFALVMAGTGALTLGAVACAKAALAVGRIDVAVFALSAAPTLNLAIDNGPATELLRAHASQMSAAIATLPATVSHLGKLCRVIIALGWQSKELKPMAIYRYVFSGTLPVLRDIAILGAVTGWAFASDAGFIARIGPAWLRAAVEAGAIVVRESAPVAAKFIALLETYGADAASTVSAAIDANDAPLAAVLCAALDQPVPAKPVGLITETIVHDAISLVNALPMSQCMFDDPCSDTKFAKLSAVAANALFMVNTDVTRGALAAAINCGNDQFRSAAMQWMTAHDVNLGALHSLCQDERVSLLF